VYQVGINKGNISCVVTEIYPFFLYW